MQDLSLTRHLELKAFSEVAQQVDASFVDTQEMHGVYMPSQPEMPRDIHVDACLVQLAGFASIASSFGGLMSEMLISISDIAAAVGAFSECYQSFGDD